MRRLCALLFWGMAMMGAHPAVCAEDGDKNDKQARMHFEEGIRLFQEGDIEGASLSFNRAYELRPSYKILYNVGQVEAELKHYCRALAAYSEYLASGGEEIDSERSREVSDQVSRLKLRVGSVAVAYQQDGVTVLIDEERRAVTPMEEPLCVDMGTHELSLREGVAEIYRESFRIAGGQALTLDLTVKASPTPVDTSGEGAGPVAPEDEAPRAGQDAEETDSVGPTEATAIEASARGTRKWTWAAFGLGAGLAAAGGIVGAISLSKESSLKDRCDNYVCDSSEQGTKDTVSRLNLTADILFGAAGAAAVTGLVLFFVEPRASRGERVSFAPSMRPGGVGLTLEGRF